MRFPITGGAGFIGSHLAEALIDQGDRVHILDDLSTGSIDNLRDLKKDPRFSYTIDTCASPSIVAELVDEADVVYHLAAAVGVDLIIDSPVRTIETNVHCTVIQSNDATLTQGGNTATGGNATATGGAGGDATATGGDADASNTADQTLVNVVCADLD